MTGPGPLAGCRVLVPRPPHQASALAARVREAGGEPIEAATITTEPGDRAALHRAVAELRAGGYAAVFFTSSNGVRALADAGDEVAVDGHGMLDHVELVGAVGPATAGAVVERFGRQPDLIPDTATGAALGAAAPAGRGRVLLPRGDLARHDLDVALAERGWTPVHVDAYRTVTADALPDEVLGALAAGEIDLLAFTSPSTVRAFLALVGDRPWSARAVSIGPVTSAACRDLGVEVAAEADPHDLDGLLAALVRAAVAL